MKPRPALCILLTLAACGSDPRVPWPGWNPLEPRDDPGESVHPEGDRFQAYLDEAVAAGLPGVALLVRSPTDGTWAGAAGLADVAGGRPWRSDTLGRAGSVTKLFASTVILRLAEQGALTLDTPLRDLIAGPALSRISNVDVVTLRQLLNHTSGIFDYLSAPALLQEAFAPGFEYQPKERLLEHAYDEPAAFAPGAGWSYSNTNYLLLELAAEAVTGQTGPELMAQHVLEPLGLTSTRYAPELPPPQAMAHGYADLPGQPAPVDVTALGLERFHFDGGVVSNVHDLADFLDAVLGPDLLSDTSRRALLDFVPTGGASQRGTDHYGAGIILEASPEHGRVLGHLGTTVGFTTHLYRVVETGVTFAAIVNGSQSALEQLSYEWFSPLLGSRVLDLVSPAD